MVELEWWVIVGAVIAGVVVSAITGLGARLAGPVERAVKSWLGVRRGAKRERAEAEADAAWKAGNDYVHRDWMTSLDEPHSLARARELSPQFDSLTSDALLDLSDLARDQVRGEKTTSGWFGLTALSDPRGLYDAGLVERRCLAPTTQVVYQLTESGRELARFVQHFPSGEPGDPWEFEALGERFNRAHEVRQARLSREQFIPIEG